jgi:hypothetical protein
MLILSITANIVLYSADFNVVAYKFGFVVPE